MTGFWRAVSTKLVTHGLVVRTVLETRCTTSSHGAAATTPPGSRTRGAPRQRGISGEPRAGLRRNEVFVTRLTSKGTRTCRSIPPPASSLRDSEHRTAHHHARLAGCARPVAKSMPSSTRHRLRWEAKTVQTVAARPARRRQRPRRVPPPSVLLPRPPCAGASLLACSGLRKLPGRDARRPRSRREAGSWCRVQSRGDQCRAPAPPDPPERDARFRAPGGRWPWRSFRRNGNAAGRIFLSAFCASPASDVARCRCGCARGRSAEVRRNLIEVYGGAVPAAASSARCLEHGCARSGADPFDVAGPAGTGGGPPKSRRRRRRRQET